MREFISEIKDWIQIFSICIALILAIALTCLAVCSPVILIVWMVIK